MDRSPIRDSLALGFASLFPLAMTLLYFVVLAKPEADEANPAFMAAYTGGKCVQFLFPVLYIGWYDRAQLRFAFPTSRGCLFGAGFGLLVAVSMFALYFAWMQHLPAFSETAPRKIHHRLQQFGQNTPLGYLQMALFISTLHSLWEEYYWRWFVFGGLRRLLPGPQTIVAIVLSSIGFMLHHVVILGVFFPGNFWMLAAPFSLCIAFGGGVWAWLYDRSQSLYAPWLSHAIIDGAIMALGYVMLRDYW